MNRTIFKATAVAALTLASATAASAQQSLLNFGGQVRIVGTSDPAAPLVLDFLNGNPPVVVGTAMGAITAGTNTGIFAGISAGAQGTIQDLSITAANTVTQPAGNQNQFVTIGGYTFTLGPAVTATTGTVNFGPISLTQKTTGTVADLEVRGTVSGNGIAPGATYVGLLSTQFAGQTVADVFNSFNTGGATATVTFSGNFVTTASVIPEPSTYALLATGVAGLGLIARRRRQA